MDVLESSYILYQLQPYHDNLNKRIIKSPKIFFYDTGLLCYLLGITSVTSLKSHKKFGSIFENWIITEIRKNQFNRGERPTMYIFRDSGGNEIDLILEKGGEPIAIEIKSSRKFSKEMLSGLNYWLKNNGGGNGILIYSGNSISTESKGIQVANWPIGKDI